MVPLFLRLASLLLVLAVPAIAETPSVEWVERLRLLTGASADVAAASTRDAAGNLYVTGRTRTIENGFDFFTVKFEPSGNVAWARQYDGPEHKDDQARAIAVDSSGNVIVTGVSVGDTPGGDFATVKYDAQGTELWTRRYDGPANAADVANAIGVDSLGNVVVTGQSIASGTTPDYLTIKYSESGAELWQARYNGPGNSTDRALAMAIDTGDSIFVAGGSFTSATFEDYAVVKYIPDGTQQWVARYNGPSNSGDTPNAIALDPSGNIYVTGRSLGSGTGDDMATVKFDAAGVQVWASRYTSAGNFQDQANAIALDTSGNVFVTGSSSPTGGNSQMVAVGYNAVGMQQWATVIGTGVGNGLTVDAGGSVYVTGSNLQTSFAQSSDVLTAKLTSAGALTWSKTFSGSGSGMESGLKVSVEAGTGNVTVVGTLQGNGAGADLGVLQYNSSGTQLGVFRQGGSGNGKDTARASTVDADGNIYVTGRLQFPGGEEDYITAKYSEAGELLWTARYNGPANLTDVPAAIAVDSPGNVYVTGISPGGPNPSACTTIKYSPDGQELWVARHVSAGSSSNLGTGIVIDSAGFAYVSANSTVPATGQDVLTLKYDPNGNLLWERRFAGPANGTDVANGIVLSPAEDFIVTFGSSVGTGTGGDALAIKYDLSGTQQWVARYNGPGNLSDTANSAVIDASGAVYVGGSTTGSTTGPDFAVIKFAPDGSLAWNVSRSFHNSFFESASRIALDPDGNVIAGGTTGVSGALKMTVAKYSPLGEERWFHQYNVAGTSEFFFSLAVDLGGNAYALGYTVGASTASNDVLLYKLNRDGVQEWSLARDIAGTTIDLPAALSIDRLGDIVISGTAGQQIDPNGTTDIFLLKVTRAEAPLAATQPASGIGPTTATLHGLVNPGGTETAVAFEYGTTSAYGSSVAAVPSPIAGSAGTEVIGVLSNLQPHTKYHYRVTATNRKGTAMGEDATFTTENRKPTVQNDTFHRALGSLGALAVLVNDSDPDNDSLTIAATTNGAYGVAATDGVTVLYIPSESFDGNDSFTYTVDDGFGGMETATVSLTNAIPTASGKVIHPTHGPLGSTVVDVTELIADADGDILTIGGKTDGNFGSVAITNNLLTYTANAGFTGNDSFTYTVDDGCGGRKTATVSLTNAIPTAGGKVIHPTHGPLGNTVVDVTELIADADGDMLTISGKTDGNHGSVTITNNLLTYTADAGFTGNDSFTYTAADGAGGFATGVVTLTNTAPLASDDSFSIGPGAAAFSVLENDSDPDGDSLTIASASAGAFGTVTVDGSTITYTPTSVGFEGIDSFSYTTTDGRGATASAVVRVKADYRVDRELISSTGAVPGVDGGLWRDFGIPSLFSEGREYGFRGTFENSGRRGSAIFGGDLGAPALRIRSGLPATDSTGSALSGTTFRRFGEPSFATSTSFAFTANLAVGAAGQQKGLWAMVNDKVVSVARVGSLAAGTTGARFGTIVSYAMPSPQAVFFTARLKPQASEVRADNDFGLWVWTESGGMKPVLREGQVVNLGNRLRRVRTFQFLTPVNGSPGHARYDSSTSTLYGLVGFQDRATALVSVDPVGQLHQLAITGETNQAGFTPIAIGLPSPPGNDLSPVALVTFEPETAGGENFRAIFDFGSQSIIAREGGQDTGVEASTFKSFGTPVAGLDADGNSVVVFQATLNNAKPTENTGLWAYHTGNAANSLQLLAREGSEPPGASGTIYASFDSISVLEGRGAVFIARLKSNANIVSAKNDRGCWAVASDGSLRLLCRESEEINGKTVRSFDLLGSVRGSPGQRRAWASGDATPSLVYRATYTDGSKAILCVAVP
jgi:uncharacterized delta-60 repeat protein